jgi:hypothetical protein
MSKGSSPRPFSVSQHEYDTRWDAIFSKDLKCDKCGETECPQAIDPKQDCVYTKDTQSQQGS